MARFVYRTSVKRLLFISVWKICVCFLTIDDFLFETSTVELVQELGEYSNYTRKLLDRHITISTAGSIMLSKYRSTTSTAGHTLCDKTGGK